MAHIWFFDGVKWKDLPIAGDSMDLMAAALVPDNPSVSGSSARLVRSDAGANAAGRELWVLLASPQLDVRVNGETTLGLRVLRDRDEISIERGMVYFSTEQPPRVLPFDGQPVPCARCKLPIEAGNPAVSCPGCSVWHHQSAEYPCWTYSEHCSLCPHETDLKAGYQWSPEEY